MLNQRLFEDTNINCGMKSLLSDFMDSIFVKTRGDLANLT